MVFCAGCGTPLKAPQDVRIEAPAGALPLPKSPPRELNARSATIILLVASVAVEVFCGSLVALIAIVVVATQGAHDPQRTLGVMRVLTPEMTVLIVVLGGIVMVLASRALIRDHLKDTSPNGAAWVRGRWPDIIKALLIGLLVGACAHAINKVTKSHVAHRNLGPLARMALTPGLPRIIWVVVGVLLTPPFEELLFRGVLYGGYRKSFGPGWAAVSTTLIFVALHLPETIYFLPAMAGVIGVAAAALWCRLRSRAIGPAIAAHVGYNIMIALFFFASGHT